MIALRYEGRTKLWYVDMATLIHPTRRVARGLYWCGPWRTAKGAATLDVRPGT